MGLQLNMRGRTGLVVIWRSERGPADESVHLVVTSPPYFDLIEYADGAGQLGHVHDYEHFLQELDKVWKECLRVLIPGGRLCIVVGDVCRARRRFGKHEVIPLHADILVRCRHIGYEGLDTVFWHKIANAATEVGGPGAALGKPYEPNGVVKNDVEFILRLKKPGPYRKPTPLQHAGSMLPPEEYDAAMRQVWSDIPGASRRDGHPTPYPVAFAAGGSAQSGPRGWRGLIVSLGGGVRGRRAPDPFQTAKSPPSPSD